MPGSQKRIWPVNTFVEFDQGLYSAMARLRDALGDSSDSPRFIETVARRGYRFIAPVTTVVATADVTAEEKITTSPNKTLTVQRLVVNLVVGLIGGALLLTVVLVFNIVGVRDWLHSHTSPIRSIAVLPLENLSGDPEQEYFVDGITDELTTDLAQLPGIRVISRTSANYYRKSMKTLPEIAKELNVDAVVEGTVERSADRVRIRVQLVRGVDDRHLWAQALDRDLRDVLFLQNDAAREIANQIGVKLVRGSSDRQRHFMSAEAYDSYLRGRYYSRTGKREDLERAITYFQQAIERDPQAALAYSGLSDVYDFEAYFGPDRKEAAGKARFAALKAIELNPDLADPHLAMTGIAELEWNWAEAENHYKRALELEPGLPEAHLHYGMFLAASGRFAQALPEIQLALQLDPVSPDTRASAGFSY